MSEITKRAWLPMLVVGLILVAIGLTFFSPLYPDEVAYKIYLERFFINGGFKQSVAPFCPEGFLVKPPALLIPAAAFWSMISHFGSDMLSYRVIPYIGILIVFAVIIIHNAKKGGTDFWPLLLFVTLGPTLYGLVLLRPEVLVLSCGALMFLLGQTLLETRRASLIYLYSFAMLVLFSLIAYIHPKALYLSLLVATAISLGAFKIELKLQRLVYAGVFAIGLLSIAHAGMGMHQAGFLSCSSAPNVDKLINSQAVNPLQLFENPTLFLQNIRVAFGFSALKLTFQRLFFLETYETIHLPERETTDIPSVLANEMIAAAVVFFVAYIIWKSILCLRRLKDKDERRQLYLTISFLLALIIPFVLSTAKHFYEVAFFACSLMIGAALLWPLRCEGTNESRFRSAAKFLPLLLIASGLSSALVYVNYTTSFMGGYEGASPYSRVDRAAIGEKVQTALLDASIPKTAPLIVEDLTYDAVRKHPLVIPITNLVQIGDAPDTVKQALARYDVRYGITSCQMANWLGIIVPIKRLEIQSFGGAPSGTAELCLFSVK